MKSKIREYLFVWSLGAFLYSLIEILWRGYTHWSMSICGGTCFSFLYKIQEKMKKCNFLLRALAGGMLITILEFFCGCLVNLKLKWKIWDYTKQKYNIKGQICLLYCFLWVLLCIPAMKLCSVVKNKMFFKS